MYKVLEGNLIAKGKRFGIVVSRFNNFLTQNLLDGAIDALKRHGAGENDIEVAWVPGSFEIPYAAKRMAKDKKFNAVICLGVVIRGGTPHFEYIANETAKGIANISLETGVPTIFGIVTADTLEQAIERSGTKQGNRGEAAALSAIEMANLFEAMK